MATTVLAIPAANADEPVLSLAYTTTQPGATPAQACANSENVVVAQLLADGVVVDQFPLAGPGDLTRGACVSTVTQQVLTTAAYVANCKVLEATVFGGYPYSFYGDPALTAKNRSDCVSFLRMFHTSLV
jgi:hypothetical protein